MKLMLVFALILAAQTSFAEGRRATKAEVKMLCKGVDKMLEVEAADAAVDMQKCVKNPMRALYDLEGTTIVGEIPMNTPNRPIKQTCQGVVRGRVVKLVSCSL